MSDEIQAWDIASDEALSAIEGSLESYAWPMTPVSGTKWEDHRFSIVDMIIKMSNELWRKTKVVPRTVTVGSTAYGIIKELPGFKQGEEDYFGKLNGNWNIVPNFNAFCPGEIHVTTPVIPTAGGLDRTFTVVCLIVPNQ